jgi:hypothetical protein
MAKGGTGNIDLCFLAPNTASNYELQWDGVVKIKLTKQ